MKKNMIFVCFICFTFALNAQYFLPVKDAFSYVKDYTAIPYSFDKDCELRVSCYIQNPGNIMPDRLYQNFQLTEYFLARENPETAGTLRLKFKLKNGYDLGLVDFGGVTDWMTYDLITVNKSSEILDALEAGILVGWVMPKQFRITADEKIIVTQFVTTERVSVKMVSFSKVTGYIIETVYHIDASGKFVEESKKQCTGIRTFTREQLENPSTNLWDLY